VSSQARGGGSGGRWASSRKEGWRWASGRPPREAGRGSHPAGASSAAQLAAQQQEKPPGTAAWQAPGGWDGAALIRTRVGAGIAAAGGPGALSELRLSAGAA